MKKQSISRRILSGLLALVLVLSLVPAVFAAGETETYTKITSMEQLTNGQYVMVLDTGYAVEYGFFLSGIGLRFTAAGHDGLLHSPRNSIPLE